MNLQIINHSTTDNLGGYDEDDSWSRDSTHTNNNVLGFKFSRGSDFDVIADFDVKVNDVYLLSVIYSTGDSFGQDGGEIEYIGVYSDENLASEQAIVIEQNKCHSVDLVANNGKKYKQHCPWVGFFESVESVNVDLISML